MLLTSVTFKTRSEMIDDSGNDVPDNVMMEICDKITEVTDRFEDMFMAEVKEIATNYGIEITPKVKE